MKTISHKNRPPTGASYSCFGPWRNLLLAIALWLASAVPARAQWLTQTFELNPGWNAIHLHVNATNDTLLNLAGALSPISEVWLWQPNASAGRIIANPSQPISGSDWVQWSKTGSSFEAFSLRANATYLVRNSSSSKFSWSLKGIPVPPESKWTSSGLNFIGFSTRADNPPLFANFLAAAQSSTPFDIFYYPGGEALGGSPNTVSLLSLNTTRATRGQAVWLRKRDNSDNRYFGPFEVGLQNYRGVVFSDSLGSYSLRLRNQLSQSNTITATYLESEISPAGQGIPSAPLFLRTAIDSVTLKYGTAELPLNQAKTFVLAPKGQPGSEMEVVIGLDRSNMAGAAGALFAGILRLQDATLGHLQIDLPVTATQASSEGLWVGGASITQVGNYLKTYAKATNAVDFSNQLPVLNALNDENKTVVFPSAGVWTRHSVDSTEPVVGSERGWVSVSASTDGTKLVAAATGDRLYTSGDKGASWTARDIARAWVSVATSSDGNKLVAAVGGGQLYTSTDAGVNWAPRENNRNWAAVASSANGNFLVAAVTGGQLYTSVDAGGTWLARATDRNWVAVASSMDGTRLVAAVAGGQLYTSVDGGANWTEREGARNWSCVAISGDGATLVAAANRGQIFTSTDGGANWAGRESIRAWSSLAASANGAFLLASEAGGQLYISTDGGATWTARESDRNWSSVASSVNGANLVAVAFGGRIHTSVNGGLAWSVASPLLWSCLASSADGVKLAAGTTGGRIYTSTDAGATWAMRVTAPAANWQALASSADGVRLLAAVNGGRLYGSVDSGITWLPLDTAPIANWRSVASSADGLKVAALSGDSGLYTSLDAGFNWTLRLPAAGRNWLAIASSADGAKLLAAAYGGQLYSSANSGANWTALFGAPSANWQAVASSMDGRNLVAVESPGGIYASTDFGVTWDLKASAPLAANWRSVAISTNGNVLVAAIDGGRLYTSINAGASWQARDGVRNWSAVTASADGTALAATENRGAAELYTFTGVLNTPELTYDPTSNRILSGGGKYLTVSFDTALGDVPSPFPLRIILHHGADGVTKMLQHVFVGADKTGTNAIITLSEADLHPGMLAQARRITAVHLPLSSTGWPLNGVFGGVGIMNAVLNCGFDDQTSNPFVHAYHPDHDNRDALFKPIGKAGVESYEIKRQITLSFTPPGDDFTSRTQGGKRLEGTYLENIVLKGTDNQTRTIVTKGSFVLNRVSEIGVLK